MSQFLTEVRAQPEALRALVAHYRGAEGAQALETARALCAAPGARLLFTGMGSSYHAPGLVKTRLAAAGIWTEVAEAGELVHYGMQSVPPDAVVAAISQSGESVETLQAAEGLAATLAVIAVTNEPDSALARCAQVVLPLRAGAETAISTKTYSNTLAVLHLLATAVSLPEPQAALQHELERLEAVAGKMDEILAEGAEDAAAAAGYLEGTDFLYFIARGPARVAAQQAALTFNEGARLPTCALSGGAFRHGPLELAGPAFSGVFLAPEGVTRELVEGVAGETARAGGRVVVVTTASATSSGGSAGQDAGRLPADAGAPEADAAPRPESASAESASPRRAAPASESQAGPEPAPRPGPNRASPDPSDLMTVRIPNVGEDLFPLAACVFLELLLYRMAHERGLEAGVFERITKVTRRE